MKMKLSKEKKEKISEQILSLLYHSFPKQLFTSEIAKEIARDEEFIKNLLLDLKDKNLVIALKKNEKGLDFIRRIRWQLTSPAYQAYHQKAQQQP
jgi:predicted transcriptional regulator